MKRHNQTLFGKGVKIAEQFNPSASVVLYRGDCLDLLKTIPGESFQLIVTSPPYNIGKEYEKKLNLDTYLRQQAKVIADRHGRRGVGAETFSKYADLAETRIRQETEGTLRTRPMDRPVYDPVETSNNTNNSPRENNVAQNTLFENRQKVNNRRTKK